MKDFTKMVGATLVGLLLWTILMGVFTIIGLAGILASEGNTSVDEGTILRIRLQGVVTERANSSLLTMLSDDKSGLALDEALEAIDKASTNENISGIYLEGGALIASPAMLQEIRQALVRFKKNSKKFVVAYGDIYTQGSYYICSVADEVYLNPEGMLDWHGLAAEHIFFTDVMKKLGVKVQVFKVGTFKSAVEPFINTQMSEANRTQTTSYLTSIWDNMTKEVSASRKISVPQLNALADSMLAFHDAKTLLSQKMVDKLCYKDEVRALLKKKMQLDEDQSLTFASVSTVAHTQRHLEKVEDCIAIYYAYGDIVDNMTRDLTGSKVGGIAPEPMNQVLDELMEDESIKAVVIRVNSGGGSAYASEQIWRQIALLKAKKPVVISMGGMAASGGYYIACNASRIVAEPTTLTGSIGIFGMFPDYSELLTQKVGLHYDMVKTNQHGDFGTMSRPMNEDEGRLMQAYVNRGYDLFTRRVAEGRKMPQDSVKRIAEGRVWTGEQALKIGLVDELGDMQTAIKAAARLAKLDQYTTDTYPQPTSWTDDLFGGTDAPDYMENQLKAYLGTLYAPLHTLLQLRNQQPIQARLPYEIVIHN